MLEDLKNIRSQKSDLQKFGITMGLILLAIAGFLFFKEKESSRILFILGFAFLIVGFKIPFVLKPIYWIWMILSTILGWIMTRLILCLVYYIILTPIGLIKRLCGKKFLELNFDYSKESYWNIKEVETFDNKKYEKQF